MYTYNLFVSKWDGGLTGNLWLICRGNSWRGLGAIVCVSAASPAPRRAQAVHLVYRRITARLRFRRHYRLLGKLLAHPRDDDEQECLQTMAAVARLKYSRPFPPRKPTGRDQGLPVSLSLSSYVVGSQRGMPLPPRRVSGAGLCVGGGIRESLPE